MKKEKSPGSPIRVIGSRDLHRNLPAILRELAGKEVRYVLTNHGKPRAVLIGADAFLSLMRDKKAARETLESLQRNGLSGAKARGAEHNSGNKVEKPGDE